MCAVRGAKTTETWVWLLRRWTDEQTQHQSLSLNYRGALSHNSLPSWYLQHLQRDGEKDSFLLQPSGIQPGCLTWDTDPQVQGAAANVCAFLLVSDQARAVLFRPYSNNQWNPPKFVFSQESINWSQVMIQSKSDSYYFCQAPSPPLAPLRWSVGWQKSDGRVPWDQTSSGYREITTQWVCHQQASFRSLGASVHLQDQPSASRPK